MSQEKATSELPQATADATPATPPVEYIGHMERIEGGVAIGWITYTDDKKNNGEHPVSLQVICNGKIVGHGIADIFRDDLEKAGISKGKCAFNIDIADVDQLTVKSATYTLMDSNTGDAIKGIELNAQLML